MHQIKNLKPPFSNGFCFKFVSMIEWKLYWFQIVYFILKHPVVFRQRKNTNTFGVLFLNESPLEKVSSITYLGVVLTEDLELTKDTDRALKSFLAQFNSMYNKFYFLPANVLGYLFITYCCSFYGINLWFEESIKVKDLRKVEVSYHRAIKKIASMRFWESNHTACEQINVNLFKHLLINDKYLLRY